MDWRERGVGFIRLYLGCDAGAVAHEIGHGFHEALNHNKATVLPFPSLADDGEAVAEAIRYSSSNAGNVVAASQRQADAGFCGYNFIRHGSRPESGQAR